MVHARYLNLANFLDGKLRYRRADTIAVVRPAGSENASLPVLVWIYGGGLAAGSSADPQYNLSGIVQASQNAGRPIVAASINYRLSVWGFLQSPQILAEGSSNAGLLDQRMALRWIQENIGAFGGDPNRVTIWGESAGAQSIGLHLHSYGGRDDGLYSGAILESGGPIGTDLQGLAYYGPPLENLTRTVGCWGAGDQLSCLRSLSSEQLFAAQTSTTWNPIVDGDFLTAYPSDLMAQGTFVHVPILDGANTDEGVSFSVKGLDNTTAVYDSLFTWRRYSLSPPTIRTLLDLYPEDMPEKPPYHVPGNITFPQYGLQWRRSAARRSGDDGTAKEGLRRIRKRWSGCVQLPFRHAALECHHHHWCTTFRQRGLQFPKYQWSIRSAASFPELQRSQRRHWAGLCQFRV